MIQFPKYDEIYLSHSRSSNAGLPRPNAVWLFPAGAICGDGGVWSNGISVLQKAERNSVGGVRSAGTLVPAYLQDCIGTADMECNRRVGCRAADRVIRVGEAA